MIIKKRAGFVLIQKKANNLTECVVSIISTIYISLVVLATVGKILPTVKQCGKTWHGRTVSISSVFLFIRLQLKNTNGVSSSFYYYGRRRILAFVFYLLYLQK